LQATRKNERKEGKMDKEKWEKLGAEELDQCAETNPWAALKYAADRLTPERKSWCEGEITK